MSLTCLVVIIGHILSSMSHFPLEDLYNQIGIQSRSVLGVLKMFSEHIGMSFLCPQISENVFWSLICRKVCLLHHQAVVQAMTDAVGTTTGTW